VTLVNKKKTHFVTVESSAAHPSWRH